MAQEKQDLRVKKTQRALSASLLTLLETQPFGKITVNDICTEAMVSRSAFYVHFEDKYALLEFCMDTLRERVFSDSGDISLRERIRAALQRISENQKIFKNLIMSQLDHELLKMMRSSFINVLECENECSGAELTGPPDITAVFYAAGITSTIIYWIDEKMKYTVDEMTEYLLALVPGT